MEQSHFITYCKRTTSTTYNFQLVIPHRLMPGELIRWQRMKWRHRCNQQQWFAVAGSLCDKMRFGCVNERFSSSKFQPYFKSMMQQATPDCLQCFVWTSCSFKQPLRFDFTSASFFQVCVLPVYPSRRRSTWSKFHPRCALRVPISI